MPVNKIKNGIYSDSVIFFLSILIGFTLIPLYLKYITIIEYGVFASVQAFVALVSLADIGLSMYVMKKISSNDVFFSKYIKTYLSSAQVFQYILGVVLLFLGFFISLFVSEFLSVKDELANEAKSLFIFSWLSVIISIIFGLNHAVMRSRQELQFMNYAVFMILIFSSCLNILFMHCGFSLKWMGVSLFLATLLVNVYIAFEVYKRYDIFIFKVSFFDKEFIKEGWCYVKQFQLLRIAQVSKTSLFTVLLSNYSGQMIVAQYNITNKLPSLVPGFISKVVMNFFPRFSSYLESGQLDLLCKEYKIIFRYGVFLSIFLSLAVWFANPKFILIWVGGDLFIGKEVFVFIVITMAIMLFISFTGLIIQASGDFRNMPLLSIFEVFIFFLLSYLLFQYYGVFGFFLGFVISILVGFIYSLILISEILKVNVFLWIKGDFFRIFALSISIVILNYILNEVIESAFIYLCVYTAILSVIFIYFSNKYLSIKLLFKGRLYE